MTFVLVLTLVLVLLRSRGRVFPWWRGSPFGCGLTLRLGGDPFDLRRLHRVEWKPVRRNLPRLLGRSSRSRLGLDREIRLRSYMRLRRNVVPAEFSNWFRHNRRTGKSQTGRREFLGACSGCTTRRVAFQRLPLLAESLHRLRLLTELSFL